MKQDFGPPRRRGIWAYAFLALILILHALSAFMAAWTVLCAIQSIQWRRLNNLAELGLLLVGAPTALVQIIVLLPLTAWLARFLDRRTPRIRAGWLLWIAVLLASITSAAVVIGIAVTENRR